MSQEWKKLKISFDNNEELLTVCELLRCNPRQLEFCRMKVGDSFKSIEAFWRMNQDRIKHMFPDKTVN